MNIKIVEDTLSVNELKEIAQEFYGSMIKGVVDIERNVIALGGEYHMDANVVLLEHGSKQGDVWGFNLYPGESGEKFIEYNSLINIKPVLGNRSPDIQDKNVQKKIAEIVSKHVE